VIVKFGVLAFCGLVALTIVLGVIGAIAGDDDARKDAAVRKLVSNGQECATRNGDLFVRLEDPYYAIEPDAELRATVRDGLPPALRDAYSLKVIRRGQREAGRAIFVAIGDDAGNRRDFMKGARESAADHGATPHVRRLAGTDVITYVLTAQGTRLAGVTGLVPCGGLEVIAPDVATGQRVWAALAENA
jgi:hypothetical protein